MRRRALPVLVFAAAAAAGGCSDEPSAAEERRRLAQDLMAETDGALDDERAECVADGLHESFGDDSYREVLDAADAGSDDADDPVRSAVIDIFAGCDALGALASGEG